MRSSAAQRVAGPHPPTAARQFPGTASPATTRAPPGAVRHAGRIPPPSHARTDHRTGPSPVPRPVPSTGTRPDRTTAAGDRPTTAAACTRGTAASPPHVNRHYRPTSRPRARPPARTRSLVPATCPAAPAATAPQARRDRSRHEPAAGRVSRTPSVVTARHPEARPLPPSRSVHPPMTMLAHSFPDRTESASVGVGAFPGSVGESRTRSGRFVVGQAVTGPLRRVARRVRDGVPGGPGRPARPQRRLPWRSPRGRTRWCSPIPWVCACRESARR